MNQWRLGLPTRYFVWSIVVMAVLAAVPFSAAHVRARAEALPGASGTLWVTNTITNDVAVFDAATGELFALIPVAAKPIGVVAPHGTGKVYVSVEGSNAVSVISEIVNSPIVLDRSG